MAKINSMYQKLKAWHKAAIIVGLFVVVTIVLLYMNKPSEEVVLYKNLSESASSEVTTELSKLDVDYTIDKDGTIWVNKRTETLVRNTLNEKGIPYTGQDGSEILLNNTLGASEEDKKMQEKVGTKVSLEKEILQGYGNVVDHATVQLTLPKANSIFEESSQKGSAAVTLKVKKGETLSANQVAGIQRTVSAAVPNIQVDDVAVIDTTRGVISESATNQQEGSTDYKNEVDIEKGVGQNIQTEIESTLSSIFALDNYRVNANVTINFDEIKQHTESYPNDGKTRSESKESAKDTAKGSGNKTEAGTNANADVPNYTDENGSGSSDYSSEKSSETRNYELDATIQEIKKHPQLVKTNVVVWVDQAALTKNSVDMNEFTKAIGVSAGLTPNMETNDQTAGADAKNRKTFSGTFQNGEVTIMPIQFLDQENATEKAPKKEEETSRAWIYWLIGSLALVLVAGGVVGYMLYLKRKEQLAEALDDEQFGGHAETGPEEEIEPEARDLFSENIVMTEPYMTAQKENLRAQLADLAKEDPARAAAVISKWLNER
ncbi:flagellar basal-body MS-ring/collar protein FliF [Listeria costaricensis]|uniref:flagellar basal-body MS-ring/collar protein FliF n=1 Tax=Listeria costaricensis TaxID=2026604 RepID=UPI000C07ADE1|nr:flagellar basal-body MS-ring/collar protein FliF [Listeria costaricensis]